MLELFTTFLRIGLFTIGGGYAMLPLIERDVVERRKWIEREQFLDLVAIAQSCPGVFAINISIFVGNKVSGTRGAICASLGTALPSLVIILLIAMFARGAENVGWFSAIFAGLRPAVVALIAIPTWNMAREARISFLNCWIPIVSALLIYALGVNPIYIILAAGLGGFIYGLMKD
jgi:chromate transporter